MDHNSENEGQLSGELAAEEEVHAYLRRLLQDCRTLKIHHYPGSADLIPVYERYAIACVNAREKKERETMTSAAQYATRLDQIGADVLKTVKSRWLKDVQMAFDEAGMIAFGDSKTGFFEPGVLMRVRMRTIESAVRHRLNTLKAVAAEHERQGTMPPTPKAKRAAVKDGTTKPRRPVGRRAQADFNRAVARIVQRFAPEWRDHLAEISSALDDEGPHLVESDGNEERWQIKSNKWKTLGCYDWTDVLSKDPGGLTNALDHRVDWVEKHPAPPNVPV